MNGNQYLVQTYQGRIGLGERDYYLENDANTKIFVINMPLTLSVCLRRIFKTLMLPKSDASDENRNTPGKIDLR